jgi:hypothetical protein
MTAVIAGASLAAGTPGESRAEPLIGIASALVVVAHGAFTLNVLRNARHRTSLLRA